LLEISRENPLSPVTLERINEAAAILRSGGLVAMPTETVYGLAANALDEDAVRKIFAAKQRPAWDPVIVHIDSPEMLPLTAAASAEVIDRLAQAFWPGPLTPLLPKAPAIPPIVTAGRPLAGIRMPADPVARALIRAAGVPLAAPSANRFGHISPTVARHVLDDLNGRIDCILDAGPCLHGVESTVLDPNSEPMVIYRPGAVTREEIAKASGREVVCYREPEQLATQPPEALPSPGVGLRHYAPAARLALFEAALDEMTEVFTGIADSALREGGNGKTGLLVPAEIFQQVEEVLRHRAGQAGGAAVCVLQNWGRWSEPAELAANLYASLRALDEAGCAMIAAPIPPAAGIGAALRDRMRKAASSAPLSR
jgi:L-threonylcarbamoyladenylate synthase